MPLDEFCKDLLVVNVINAGTVRHRTVANLNTSIKIFAKLNVF